MTRIAGMVDAELRKLWSLWQVPLVAVATWAMAGIVAATLRTTPEMMLTPVDMAALVPDYVQAGPIVLGVIATTSEYTSRQIVVSLAAVPRRADLVAAKLLALTASTAAISLVSMLITFHVAGATWSAGEARLTTLTVGYLTAVGLMAGGLGLVLRHLIPTLGTALGLLVIAPPLLTPLTGLARYLPGTAATRWYGVQVAAPEPGAGWLIAAWALVVCALGAVALVRKDA
ncbi:MAG: hypothetical protein QM708_07540 [Propioniciclava sp.]|uniref:hypothetical protein n=1 Tax=Propioniciclava sp. TaxID=2038686 RepID=UPI0039E22020